MPSEATLQKELLEVLVAELLDKYPLISTTEMSSQEQY